MRTTDNNRGADIESLHCEETDCIDELKRIANQSVGDLVLQNPDLLVFPQKLNEYHDDIHKSRIFSLSAKKLITYNIMGFVGTNNTQLTISSRFATAETDYFLHYMLQKVLSINIVNFNISKSSEDIWDFYLYLFPSLLHTALKQGLYKAYTRIEHNDADVKGSIDVKRHIRCDIPFAGKIAYNAREYNFDNPITELIRHTVECVKTHPFGGGILTSNADIIADVHQIVSATPSYNRNARQRIISANSKPLKHPYFTEYTILQKICLCILRHDKITYGKEKDTVYGLLFDGAWLWEEYLNAVFVQNHAKIDHPRNKERTGGDNLFTSGCQIFPDFLKRRGLKSAEYVVDAKYKHIDRREEETGRGDYYQIITYMYRYHCTNGYIFFPLDNDKPEYLVGKPRKIDNAEINAAIIEVGLPIPQSTDNFDEFKRQMKTAEENLVRSIK